MEYLDLAKNTALYDRWYANRLNRIKRSNTMQTAMKTRMTSAARPSARNVRVAADRTLWLPEVKPPAHLKGALAVRGGSGCDESLPPLQQNLTICVLWSDGFISLSSG